MWPDGNPKMQLRIVLATGVSEGDDDNGHRAIFVRGNMQQAVRDAIKSAGVDKIQAGGTLAVKYTGDGTKTKAAYNAPKQYAAQYKPPVAQSDAIDADDLF
jgi:hypothetical protein